MRVREKMPLAVGPIVVGSALAAGAILRATEREALLSGPEYIRDAEPEGLTRRIGLGLARQACRRYADNPGGMDPTAAAKYENACRPYLDGVGYGAGSSIDQPFSGGQCAVQYRIDYSFTREDGLSFTESFSPFSGPIIPEIWGGVGPGDESQASNCASVGGTFRRWLIRSGSQPQQGLGLVSGCNATLNSFTATRLDGQPDDCGPPPPVITQPEPPDQPGPTFEPIIIAPQVNIEAGVTVNVDGTVEVQIGDDIVQVDPFGGDGGDSGNPPGAPEGGPVLPGGNGGFGGDDELGEPPAGKRWVGVCMAITQRPESFGTIPTNTVDKVYPEVVGNVRLICNASGLEVVNTPVQIRSDRVCLWEPVRGLNPVAIRVNLKAGFGYSYQGYAQPIDN